MSSCLHEKNRFTVKHFKSSDIKREAVGYLILGDGRYFTLVRFLQVNKYQQVPLQYFHFPTMMLACLIVGMLYVVSGKYLLVETEGEEAADYQYKRPDHFPPPISPDGMFGRRKMGTLDAGDEILSPDQEEERRLGPGDYHDGPHSSGDGSGDDVAGDYHGDVQHPGEHFHNGDWHLPEDEGNEPFGYYLK